jgi:Spy/CpxP family protein refolding chaperone
MRKFAKALTAAAIAGSAIAVAVPAQAQYYPQQHRDRWDDRDDDRWEDRRGDRNDRDGRHGYDREDYGRAQAIRAQIEQLRYRVDRIDYRDRISEREAAALRRAVHDLRLEFRDLSRNGLSHREARYLQDRINRIRERLRYERHDRDGRRW